MSTQILVAKHVPDYRRNEPRNVGVIVADDTAHAARFFGEDDTGQLDGRRAKPLVGGITEVYHEWVVFWRESLDRGPDGLQVVLDERAPNFYVEHAAHVWDEEPPEPAALAEHYYAELVGEPERTASDPTLKQQVDALLHRTGVTELPGFQWNQELLSEGFTRPLPLRFPYARQNGHLIVADRADLSNAKQTSSLLFGFEHAPHLVKKVAFYPSSEVTDAAAESYLHALDSLAHLIDIDTPTADDDTRSAFG